MDLLEQENIRLSGVVPGDVIRISVWIKGMDLHPDSAAAVGDAWSVAITPIFHNNIGNNAGWGEYLGKRHSIKVPECNII
ncbi:MAG: hypothetical protein M0C28_37155 [Candidatus Moduliflexus flocculans]|nr:hypothetical protein [Candidatus Moduliflexus flocculans]